mmetsp:Transcript_39776/g.94305  ORF Transcript_39776/g.94305 Transcript_39776/m.94305 type:complete len:163 (+) Transcript_39776:166-654(+)|eukprot:CAMPEP_0177696108 /NCGR_PEP_ID=MMETSP0484_2-20121128/3806_1 /TAXON_ID=354590 /ORGANISM="Rhodomonas lens, Strain RHODO" /LENGTH=162 /DNA_ID=CAMNT_0019207061 /DNA_START=56 /DNA_END=544 /DNA_ORIENTATION=-
MGNTLECCAPCTLDQKQEARRMQPGRTIESREKDSKTEDPPGTPKKQDTPGTRGVVLDDEPSLDLSQTNSDAGGNPSSTSNFTFRNFTRQDYFTLYDAIHKLTRQEEISKDQEELLYDLIGRQDKALATAYKKYKDDHDPLVLIEAIKGRPISKVGKKGAQV